ncbi:MAG: c-type cytochrome biogenesis protein CcmI [Pseudomonadales bacterium]
MLFWVLVSILGVVAAAFVIVPLYLHRNRSASDSRVSVNVDIYEERLAELQASFESGDIDEEEFAHLKTELQKNLLSDADDPEQAVHEGNTNYRGVPIAAALLVPLFAFLAYSDWGLSWGAIQDHRIAEELQSQDPHDVEDMGGTVRRLEKRLVSQPDNHQGWYLLGQSYMSMGRHEKAVEAFQHLQKSFPEDAGLLAYMAQALYLADERQFTPRVEKAVSRTLELDPRNITMLEIRAMGAIQSGRPEQALSDFRAALAAGAQGRRAQMLASVIGRLESELGIDSGAQADGAEDEVVSPGGSQRALSIRVEVENGLPITGRERVFVFARAMNGPPMPLAVQELDVADLPRTVNLDESMAMMPEMGLDDFDEVQVVARISTSGIANVSPNDFEAVSDSIDLTRDNSMITLHIKDRVGEL